MHFCTSKILGSTPGTACLVRGRMFIAIIVLRTHTITSWHHIMACISRYHSNLRSAVEITKMFSFVTIEMKMQTLLVENFYYPSPMLFSFYFIQQHFAVVLNLIFLCTYMYVRRYSYTLCKILKIFKRFLSRLGNNNS